MRSNIKDLKKNKTVRKLYEFQKIFSRELWRQISKKLIWNVLPRYRHVGYLAKHLISLPQETPERVRHARDLVFREVALDIKDREDRDTLSILLNECRNPGGIEQIFFTAIYPFARKRNLIIVHNPTDRPKRMDIELGYEGHSNEYVFWRLEIDGASDERAGKIPRMRREMIDNRRCPVYRVGVAAIFDRKKNIDPTRLIINAQNIFIAVHEDLKRYGFKTRQPKIKRSVIAKSKMSLINKWTTIKQAAKRKTRTR